VDQAVVGMGVVAEVVVEEAEASELLRDGEQFSFCYLHFMEQGLHNL